MSSDDSDFDKEAEREKLRKKYEEDDKDRENTRRMSELLLQGATMTGKHCDACGDPIFRYDGQEFCPTCHTQSEESTDAVEGTADTAEGNAGKTENAGNTAGEPATADRNAAESSDVEGTAGNATEAPDAETSDGEPRVEINDVRVAGQRGDGADQHVDRAHRHVDHSGPHSRPPSQEDHAPDSGSHDRRRQSRTHTDRDGRRGGHAGDRGVGTVARSDADLGEARAALVRKVTDLARRAEETEDVARARDLLAATREASEALAALDRANR